MAYSQTTITIRPETRDRFRTVKREGESWSDTVDRVVDQLDEGEPKADGGDRQ